MAKPPDITKVKAEVDELRKMVDDLNDITLFPVPIIMEIEPEVEFKNI